MKKTSTASWIDVRFQKPSADGLICLTDQKQNLKVLLFQVQKLF